MVGREPDLNPTIDWETEWRKLRSNDKPQISDASRSRPLIKPCHTREIKPPREVETTYVESLATPLIQVFSVCISTDFVDGKPCEIHGSIRTLEGLDCRFDLYDRDPEDSETIWKHGTLSLIGPDGGPIIPSLSTTLDLCLYDRIRGVEVVKGQLNLDPLNQDSYDRLLKGVVRGAHGFAYVYYVVFQFAVYATVQVTVTKNDNDGKNHNAADIYGSVVARYENGRRYCSDDEEVKLLETRLFDKPPHLPLRVAVGTPIRLSRNVVAVPVYSSLTLELNLWDSNGKIAGDCLQLPAYLFREDPLYIQTQFACVGVQLRWRDAYFYLYKDRKMKDSNRAESSREREEMQKKPRVLHDQHFLASSVPSRSIPPTMTTSSYFGGDKVEVFTVYVGGITGKVSALCGTIIIVDGSDKFSIYKRDESCSELLPDHGLACIEVNYRAIRNSDFVIVLKLRDPISKLEVSRGELGWNVGRLESGMRWYGKRACSVVRGKDGFAAMHYATFDNAFEAVLQVKLFGDGYPDIPISLYGTLIACYSGYDYSTSYQKKYYTSRLFDCSQDRSVELKTGSKIDMLKSIVVVPAKSSLIIEANLVAIGVNNVDQPIRGKAEFLIDLSNTTSQIIRGGDYWIEVYAQFKE